jgi:hypothetical protein
MRLFSCPSCGNVLYFENRACCQCSHQLGYDSDRQRLLAIEPHGTGFLATDSSVQRFLCVNAAQDACNWLVPEGMVGGYCVACRHNGIIPDLSVAENLYRWRELETAKHRLFYSLLRWQLPLRTHAEDLQHGLIFNFLADTPASKVMTGHENGLITIALTEADDIERERRRRAMGEPYRTLLGHFRHEIGHYFWDLLVRDNGQLDACRALFGDDNADYQAALQRHYEDGPSPDWPQHYVSAYAAVHPWEDFAETWAHYLHIVDTLEMAGSFGIRVRPAADASGALSADVDFDAYEVTDFRRLLDAWFPFVFAMNSVNRSMGAPDPYPFILVPQVIEKLNFVHALVRDNIRGRTDRRPHCAPIATIKLDNRGAVARTRSDRTTADATNTSNFFGGNDSIPGQLDCVKLSFSMIAI